MAEANSYVMTDPGPLVRATTVRIWDPGRHDNWTGICKR